MKLNWFMGKGLSCLLALTGCTYEVIPDHLEGQVREDIQLEQVEKAPDSYRGQTVVWGGEILDASRRDDHLRVEVLQLPLDRTLRPMDSRAASRGRFLVIDTHGDIKDASTLKKGTLVTVIGEVQRLVSAPLDRDTHDIPALLIRDMTVWERQLGITQYPPGSPFRGSRPFMFWDSKRVAGR